MRADAGKCQCWGGCLGARKGEAVVAATTMPHRAEVVVVRAWCPLGSSWSLDLRGVDPRGRKVAGKCSACVCSVEARARCCPGAREGEAVVGGPVCVSAYCIMVARG